MPAPHPYDALTPDLILDALETAGIRGDGRLLALGSYENRVYQVWREDDGPPVVVKFYRPRRWSDEAIGEEHAFALELAEHEVPVVAPVVIDGRTLHEHAGFRFAVYPRRGGRSPELDRPDVLAWIGRFLGRLHVVGGAARFAARPTLDIASFGDEPRAFVLDGGFVPADILDAYTAISAQALDAVRRAFDRAGAADGLRSLRLHGDCHAGNILWTDDGPHFVDLDDARMGPAVQDLWMLLSGDAETQAGQLARVLEGYEQFRDFDRRELPLIEPLRTLRLIHYSGWIARRFDDPAFPAAFPWFGTQRYWQDRILELREQVALMDEPPLAV
jgi:Ser/Thr protein kinase RdoA (MazF antagonist)